MTQTDDRTEDGPAATMMLPPPGKSSKNDDFRRSMTWRWTEQSFGLTISGEPTARKLNLDLYVPPLLTGRLGMITLTASFEGMALKKQSYTKPGPQSFEISLPRQVGDRQIDFTLDKCLPPSEEDPRELGVIVSNMSLT
jgi:hypothetical protein